MCGSVVKTAAVLEHIFPSRGGGYRNPTWLLMSLPTIATGPVNFLAHPGSERLTSRQLALTKCHSRVDLALRS